MTDVANDQADSRSAHKYSNWPDSVGDILTGKTVPQHERSGSKNPNIGDVDKIYNTPLSKDGIGANGNPIAKETTGERERTGKNGATSKTKSISDVIPSPYEYTYWLALLKDKLNQSDIAELPKIDNVKHIPVVDVFSHIPERWIIVLRVFFQSFLFIASLVILLGMMPIWLFVWCLIGFGNVYLHRQWRPSIWYFLSFFFKHDRNWEIFAHLTLRPQRGERPWWSRPQNLYVNIWWNVYLLVADMSRFERNFLKAWEEQDEPAVHREFICGTTSEEKILMPLMLQEAHDSELRGQIKIFYRLFVIRRGLSELLLPRKLIRVDFEKTGEPGSRHTVFPYPRGQYDFFAWEPESKDRKVVQLLQQSGSKDHLIFVRNLDRKRMTGVILAPPVASLIFTVIWMSVFLRLPGADPQPIVTTAITGATYLVALGALVTALVAYIDSRPKNDEVLEKSSSPHAGNQVEHGDENRSAVSNNPDKYQYQYQTILEPMSLEGKNIAGPIAGPSNRQQNSSRAFGQDTSVPSSVWKPATRSREDAHEPRVHGHEPDITKTNDTVPTGSGIEIIKDMYE